MGRLAALAVSFLLAAPGLEYEREIEAWRAQRERNLRAEEGWLSVVGLRRLEPGRNTVGSAVTTTWSSRVRPCAPRVPRGRRTQGHGAPRGAGE